MRKIGIMGGTFNPIHYGHLLIAENACAQLGLDEVRFIPTGRSPHKQGQACLSGTHRLRMVELAIADNPCFLADNRELLRDDVSYTCVTLEELKRQFPEDELYFIMGGDSLRDFHTWYQPGSICDHAVLVAAIRDDCDQSHLEDYASALRRDLSAEVRLLHTPNLSVTSRELRRRVRAGETIRYQVPETVRHYIYANALYMDPEDKK
jgi:nicotinate-nucleotide adenylyltransferase